MSGMPGNTYHGVNYHGVNNKIHGVSYYAGNHLVVDIMIVNTMIDVATCYVGSFLKETSVIVSGSLNRLCSEASIWDSAQEDLKRSCEP
jgi:hypothetical protein